MVSQLKDNVSVQSINNIWEKISGDVDNIFDWIIELDSDIDEALWTVYNDRGVFMLDEAESILEERLRQFDVSKETIHYYFQMYVVQHGDTEEFIDSLKIIIKAKINALLPTDFGMEMAQGALQVKNERARLARTQDEEL